MCTGLCNTTVLQIIQKANVKKRTHVKIELPKKTPKKQVATMKSSVFHLFYIFLYFGSASNKYVLSHFPLVLKEKGKQKRKRHVKSLLPSSDLLETTFWSDHIRCYLVKSEESGEELLFFHKAFQKSIASTRCDTYKYTGNTSQAHTFVLRRRNGVGSL